MSATRVKNFDFDNDTSKDIFSHPYIYYIYSVLLKKSLMEILITEEILDGKLHFLCSVRFSYQGNLGEKELWRKYV